MRNITLVKGNIVEEIKLDIYEFDTEYTILDKCEQLTQINKNYMSASIKIDGIYMSMFKINGIHAKSIKDQLNDMNDTKIVTTTPIIEYLLAGNYDIMIFTCEILTN